MCLTSTGDGQDAAGTSKCAGATPCTPKSSGAPALPPWCTWGSSSDQLTAGLSYYFQKQTGLVNYNKAAKSRETKPYPHNQQRICFTSGCPEQQEFFEEINCSFLPNQALIQQFCQGQNLTTCPLCPTSHFGIWGLMLLFLPEHSSKKVDERACTSCSFCQIQQCSAMFIYPLSELARSLTRCMLNSTLPPLTQRRGLSTSPRWHWRPRALEETLVWHHRSAPDASPAGRRGACGCW